MDPESEMVRMEREHFETKERKRREHKRIDPELKGENHRLSEFR